jgi:hypothetical protein
VFRRQVTLYDAFPLLPPLLLSYLKYLASISISRVLSIAKSSLPSYVFVLISFSLAVSFQSPMAIQSSAHNLFEWARLRDSEEREDLIINGEEVKKELQPSTKKNYSRALALWQQ